MLAGARHVPRTADDQSVSSIKVGDAALSNDIGLIVIHQLPQNRDSESTLRRRTAGVLTSLRLAETLSMRRMDAHVSSAVIDGG